MSTADSFKKTLNPVRATGLSFDNKTATGGNRDFSMKSRKMSAYMKSKGTMNAV